MSTAKTLASWVTNKITCWSERKQYFVALTLEESVRDAIDGWGLVDYVVSKEMYEEDPDGVKKALKTLGYYLKAKLSNGYQFEHYTKRSVTK